MATGAPGANGVWLYGEDDSEATFSTLLNKAGTTVNTQLGLDRDRITTLENLQTGGNKAGLVPIIPTSVNVTGGSGSISSTGRVSFSGTTSISINGCFNANYLNYFMVINLFTSAADQAINIRFRNAGNDFTASSYQTVYFETQAGSSTPTYTSVLNGNLSRAMRNSASGGASGELEVLAPNASIYTRALARHQDAQFYGQAGISYNTTQSFDGISLLATSAISGEIRVYGYR